MSTSLKLLSFAAYSDPILRHKIQDIEFPLSQEDRDLIAYMKYSIQPEQLKAANAPWNSAAGMAANQWGIKKRIFLYCPTGDCVNDLEVVINPSYMPIESKTIKEDDWEGCFSVPLATGYIRRDSCIDVRYQNENGEIIERELIGWFARVWQHETDHLDGHLYDDPRTHRCITKKVFNNYAELEEFYAEIRASRRSE